MTDLPPDGFSGEGSEITSADLLAYLDGEPGADRERIERELAGSPQLRSKLQKLQQDLELFSACSRSEPGPVSPDRFLADFEARTHSHRVLAPSPAQPRNRAWLGSRRL